MKINFLDEIIAYKKKLIAKQKSELSLEALRKTLAGDLPRPQFANVIGTDGIHLIAEVKKASPSVGIIRADFDYVAIARAYEQGGASCLSILTEDKYFLGSLSFLDEIKKVVALPLLRKDFIIDEYQVYEAKAHGADAILLIAAVLKKEKIAELMAIARSIALDVVLEVHTEKELDQTLDLGAAIIGLNSRNLVDFSVDLSIIPKLLKKIPKGRLTICESGVRNIDDLKFVKGLHVNAVLVGEALMREMDIAFKTQLFVECLKSS